MPPLRERENDIRLLAQSFLQRFAAQAKKVGMTFDRGAVRALVSHAWPGNVRELENCVRRAVIMAEGKNLTVQDLELTPAASGNLVTLKDAREAAEREIVERVLRKHSGKISIAAAELGISRPTLYELMEKLGIAKD
jgi:two-component system NtrC family response regulator